MRNKKWTFPHPLLTANRDDYIDSSLSLIEENHETKRDVFEFRFICCLNCPGLAQFINQGHAKAILHISSPGAKYRKDVSIDIDPGIVVVSISKNELVSSVSFTAEVMAVSDTVLPLLPEHNPEAYGDSQGFKLRAGDILAESETIKVLLDDTELLKPLSSIFQIAVDSNPTEGINYRPVFDDKIQVLLDEETYKRYDRLKRGYPIRRNLSAVITMPALTEAIYMMSSSEADEYKQSRWYRSLENRLNEAGIELTECDHAVSSIANLIYGEILSEALSQVESSIDTLSIEADEQEIGGID